MVAKFVNLESGGIFETTLSDLAYFLLTEDLAYFFITEDLAYLI